MEGLDIYEYSGYSACYCEENVYRFLEKLIIEPPPTPEGRPPNKYQSWAAFVTSYSANPGSEVAPGEWSTAVPVVCGPKPADVVFWDYHCVAVVKQTTPPADGAGEATVTFWVVDFDTKMGKGKYVAPIRYELFWGFTLSNASKNAVALIEMRIRLISALEFLTVFRTDRRHMYSRSITKENRYKTFSPKELLNPTNFQHPPPKRPRIQFASPAAGVLRGSWNREQAKVMMEKLQSTPATEWRNDHANNLAEFLNTQNVTVCVSDLVTVRELGQWMKKQSE
jgi:hypothetical protein